MSQIVPPCLSVSPHGLKTTQLFGIQRHEWTPGDGYRYVVYVTDLPEQADGGAPETHKLVTLYEPGAAWYGCGDSYILATEGDLVPSYLTTKFHNLLRLDPSMRLEAMRVIASALGRRLWSDDVTQET